MRLKGENQRGRANLAQPGRGVKGFLPRRDAGKAQVCGIAGEKSFLKKVVDRFARSV